MRIAKAYEINVYAPASFYKPPISTTEFSTEYTYRKGFIDYTIDIRKEIIANKKTTHILSTSSLENIINGAGQMPFSIDSTNFTEFVQLHKDILNLGLDYKYTIPYLSTLYDIDFELYAKQFLEECQGLESIKHTIMEDLLKYANKLDVYKYNEKDSAIRNHLSLDAAYKKIRSYKYYLKGLSNALNLYKHFEYFYIPKYAVSTGRLQSSPFYLQIQGNKLALAFLESYQINKQKLNPGNFETFKDILFKHNPELKKDMNVLNDTELFHKKSVNLYIDQVLSLCIPNVNLSQFRKERSSLVTEFNWLYKNCKKKENIFTLKALMLALEMGRYETKLIKQDATGSGPQIISMLTEDSKLMNLTNIQGTAYNDLYHNMIEEYIENITRQYEMLKRFCKEILNTTYDEFKKWKKSKNEIQNMIYNLLFMTKEQAKFKNNKSEFDTYYKNHKKDFENISKKIELLTFKVISPSIDIAAKSISNHQDKVLITLRRLRIFRENYEASTSIPKEMLTRKLFKKWIMAFAYAQGRKSRGESIKESFMEFYISKGYQTTPISEYALEIVIENLLDFFQNYSNKYFESLKSFLNGIQALIKHTLDPKKGELKVKLKYCTWKLRCQESVERRYTFKINEVNHKFTLYHKLNTSIEDVGSKVPSIFVQGVEAHIVHEFYNRVLHMNECLREANLPLMVISTNHDSLAINATYGPLLVPLMQECYNTISKLKFPVLDECLKRKYKNIKCTNPNFIRFQV